MGKGSKRRPCRDAKTYDRNFDRVMWGNKKKSHKSDRRKARLVDHGEEDR
jgi:hypothetical protein